MNTFRLIGERLPPPLAIIYVEAYVEATKQ